MQLEKYTMDSFFHTVVEKFAANPAIAFVDETPVTYRELGRQVEVFRQFLLEHQIRKGDRIILLGENSPHWCVAFLAITTSGAVVVPILSEFPESDVNHIINHSEAVAAVVEEKFLQSLDLPALEHLRLLISLDDFSLLKLTHYTTPEIEEAPEKPEKIWQKLYRIPQKIQDALKRGGKPEPAKEMPEITEDDLVEILYTSGTTGHSKGVMLTHRNILTNAISGPKAIGVVPEKSIVLNLLPLAHAYGSTTTFLGTLSCGATLYCLKRKPSPKILMQAMQKIRPHIVSGVPLIFEKIYHKQVLPEISSRRMLRWMVRLRTGRKMLYRKIGKKIRTAFGGRMQSMLIGGASLNEEVETFLREAGIPYSLGYGLSECSPLVAGAFYQDTKPGSVGPPIQDVQVKIDDPDPQTGVGEILVKGPNVMKGYFKNPEETQRVLTEDGWLRTGDLGYLDRDGHLFIKGRIKNVYVGPSGENIYPEIIEDKLRESLFVEEALVYLEEGKLVARVYPDYEYIQTVLDAPRHTIQPEEIEEILENVRKETNRKLPGFSQISKIMEQPEPFVKTPTNKIKRALYVPDYLKK